MSAAIQANAFVAKPAAVKPRAARRVVTQAAKATWYPGATNTPKYLDGSMPGDYGFDPLGLGAKKDLLKYYQNAEIINGRWAMAAVAGILAEDLLGRGDWWTAGAQEYAVDIKTQLLVGIPTFIVLEGLRARGFEKTGDFKFQDPAGMDSPETRLKEVKNARLAMVAFLGFSSQAAVQGMGPIECLQKHLENPGMNNIYTSAVGNEATVGVMALSILPIIIEALYIFTVLDLFGWNMSEEGGLGALLGAYISDSDVEDQNSADSEEKRETRDAHPASEEPQAPLQEENPATEAMLLDNEATGILDEAPEQGPQRPPPNDPEAVYAYPSGGDIDTIVDNENEVDIEDKVGFSSLSFDALPPRLASAPSGESNPEVQARIARWLELQRDGRRLTDTLRSSRDYRNPEFFKKMVEYWEIDEYGTAFAPELFNPGSLPVEDSIEALKKELTIEDERKKARRIAGTTKIEFTQGSGAGGGGGARGGAATATATAAAIKAAQAMAQKLAANRGR
ncbi:putative Photosystem I chlorophyll a/b-binding protein 6, chloroplastic [Nannochloris sp. 'desiccata']|nr:putative Photosystem I chlorophyll a/b-binding protein 6, chloroplastic [Chlorella desiccata (nom. nud.)]KAH7615724.1 putative Photosystem I chlorophyll a/b-binding protein 6, chloroplastic [Chlorella desiccata (nom. nud.)]